MNRTEQIIKDLMAYKNFMRKSHFANFLGIPKSTLANWEGRDSLNIAKIKEAMPEISTDWLMYGEGEMIEESHTAQLASPSVQEEFPLRTDRALNSQDVPLYELDATAGLVSLFDQHSRQVPVSHLQIPNLPPCDGALYVRGDSMYPLLKSGDIVLYKEVQGGVDSILWGEMYLLSFDIDGEQFITIKYIQKGDSADMLRLVSHNPHHSPKDIKADSVRALALVKASVRFNTMG